MIKYKAVCTTPVQSSKTLLFGSPAHERCWPTTCAHLIGHEIRSTIIQLCRKEPALWQVMSGTIIQLCRKKSLSLGRSPINAIIIIFNQMRSPNLNTVFKMWSDKGFIQWYNCFFRLIFEMFCLSYQVLDLQSY